MAVYRLPFDDIPGWQGAGNWDDPSPSHDVDQAYAFDFGHSVGAEVRAARGGIVATFRNDINFNNWGWTQKQKGMYTKEELAIIGCGSHVLIRHADSTVAAYCHLQSNQSFVTKKGQSIAEGQQIGLSGNTGHSSGPHLHFDVRTFWKTALDLGPTFPIQFEDKNHVSWRPKSADSYASTNLFHAQEQWRWCSKCQGMYFSDKQSVGATNGVCPAGGTHVHAGSGNYLLVLDSAAAPGQTNWKWCSKCQGLFFGGNPGSKCPAGGTHTKAGSGSYTLLHNSVNSVGQPNWRWCNKCQGLFFGGNPGSQCPAGGAHSKTGSGNYTLPQMGSGEVQQNWLWCNKCHGLFFGGNPESIVPVSKCPAGSSHDAAGSWNYMLVYDYTPPNAPGQSDWRWCSKCQGLFFGGNPGSKCPAGGAHIKVGSGNYTVLRNAPTGPGQENWRWCSKCQGLFLAEGSGSKCAAGGSHSKAGSGNYRLSASVT